MIEERVLILRNRFSVRKKCEKDQWSWQTDLHYEEKCQLFIRRRHLLSSVHVQFFSVEKVGWMLLNFKIKLHPLCRVQGASVARQKNQGRLFKEKVLQKILLDVNWHKYYWAMLSNICWIVLLRNKNSQNSKWAIRQDLRIQARWIIVSPIIASVRKIIHELEVALCASIYLLEL